MISSTSVQEAGEFEGCGVAFAICSGTHYWNSWARRVFFGSVHNVRLVLRGGVAATILTSGVHYICFRFFL